MASLNCSDELSVVETAKLENYEVIIEAGLQVFVEVGNALAAIRDEKLYRQTHATFEAYLASRWDITKQHAYRLIIAAEVTDRIAESNPRVTPESERQVRPLAKLAPADQPAAWQEAVETAPKGNVTAKHVAEVVARRLPAKAQINRLPLSRDDETSLRVKNEFRHRVRAVMGKGELTRSEIRAAIGPPDVSVNEANLFVKSCIISDLVRVVVTDHPRGQTTYRFEQAETPLSQSEVAEIASAFQSILDNPSSNARVQSDASHALTWLPIGHEFATAKQVHSAAWNLAIAAKALRPLIAEWKQLCPSEQWPELAQLLRDSADQLDNEDS